jgi:hypothetical protein
MEKNGPIAEKAENRKWGGEGRGDVVVRPLTTSNNFTVVGGQKPQQADDHPNSSSSHPSLSQF